VIATCSLSPWLRSVAVGLLALVAQRADAAPAAPSFTLDVVAADSSNLPALHSFAVGEASGKWLLIGGRTNGMHPLVASSNGGKTPPPNAFPTSQANTNLWVVDPVTRASWSASLSSLPVSIADALAATNAQAYQDGDYLYVIGGYGNDHRTNQMTTFGTITALQVSATINAVIKGTPFDSYVRQYTSFVDCPAAALNAYNACYSTESGKCQTGPGWSACMQAAATTCQGQQATAEQQCGQHVVAGTVPAATPRNAGSYVKVTGGGLQKLGGVFYLVFGQQFEGLYSVNEGDYGKWPTKQQYTEQIVSLAVTPNRADIGVLHVALQNPNDPRRQYHRRDLNVLPAFGPTGQPRIGIYGGVFVIGQTSPYRNPMVVEPGAGYAPTITTDTAYQQMMSQYECSTLVAFDRTSNALYNVFFGGISLYYLNRGLNQLQLDEGMPFIADVTAMIRGSDSSWAEYVRQPPLDSRLGANGHFVLDPAVPRAGEIVYLDAIKTRTRVGYLYGGIQSDVANTNGNPSQVTRATNLLYEVWLNPAPPTIPYWIPTQPVINSSALRLPVPPTTRVTRPPARR